jgi:hypothetical protein
VEKTIYLGSSQFCYKKARSPAATSPNEPPPKRLRRTTPPSIWDSGKAYLTFLGIKKQIKKCKR